MSSALAAPHAAIRLTLHGCSDAGLERSGNEDAFRIAPDLHLAVLADGMGGSRAGEVASAMAVEGVHRRLAMRLAGIPGLDNAPLDEAQLTALEALVRSAVGEVNRDIFQRAQQDPACAGMGTTIVVAVWRGLDLIIGHAGDSRAYRLRWPSLPMPGGRPLPPTLRLLTRDHVVAQALADAPAATGVPSNRLTRALGVEEQMVLELHRHRLEPGDLILLCSDGLTDMVSEDQIERTVAQALRAPIAARIAAPIAAPTVDHPRATEPAPQAVDRPLMDIAQALVDRALEAGGRDNITVILGHCIEVAPCAATQVVSDSLQEP